MDKSILPPVDVIFRPSPREDPLAEQNRAAKRERVTSATIGVLVALVVHLVLIAIFMSIIALVMDEELPPLVVITEGYDPKEQNEQQEFNTRVAQRPAPPSADSANTIVATAAVAPVSAPEIDRPIDDPLGLGTGLGDEDGLGFGGFGDGFGSAKFMGLQGGGKNIILVIDTSGSMPRNCGETGIAAIRREIDKSINGFTKSTRFNIICYADEADAFRMDSVPATKENKVAAMKFMQIYFDQGRVNKTRTQSFGGDEKGAKDPSGIEYVPIYPETIKGLEGTSGGSRIELGVVAAMERMPSTIFILSDGSPNTRGANGPVSHDELVKLIKDNHSRIYKGRKLIINTVSIRDLGEKFLREISSAFNGRHRKIRPEKL